MHLFHAARSIRDTLRADTVPDQLDAYLDAFAAFPDRPARLEDGRLDVEALPVEAIRVRKWGEQRAALKDVTPDDVLALRAGMARFLKMTYEIEEPWKQYSAESVETFQHGGVHRLQAFMDIVWRSDERRHAAVLKGAYEGVTQQPLGEANPHAWEAEHAGWHALRRHVYMRLVAELSASATYAVMAAHSRGALASCLLNLMGDEVRHLAVFWAAARWLTGESALHRLVSTALTTANLAAIHQENRTDMAVPGLDDMVLLTEMGGAMAFLAHRMLAWERRLPRNRLQDMLGVVPARMLPQ